MRERRGEVRWCKTPTGASVRSSLDCAEVSGSERRCVDCEEVSGAAVQRLRRPRVSRSRVRRP
jgi:hypothetical protein